MPQVIPSAPTDTASLLSGLRILLVEDVRSTLDVLAILLSQNGAEVVPCSTAVEALASLDGLAPHLIVSDIGMPEVDGFSFMQQVRNRDGCDTIPALALTAFARPEDRERSLAAGFQMHIAKPVESEELLRALRNLSGRESG